MQCPKCKKNLPNTAHFCVACDAAPRAKPKPPVWLWALGGAGIMLVLALLSFGASGGFGPRGNTQIIRQTVIARETIVAPQTVVAPQGGQIEQRGQDNAPMMFVPAGEFLMGSADNDIKTSNNETPQHTVTLDAFWIDQHEVTNGQYKMCVDAGVCSAPRSMRSYSRSSYYGAPEFNDYPVIYVSWDNAAQYCGWVGKALPTEAQWEKAARGAAGRIYPWGNRRDASRVNFCDVSCPFGYKDASANDGWADTAPVGSYSNGPSPYGVYDMAGNVWEWVADWYDRDYYKHSPRENPKGPSLGVDRVLRGGAWDSAIMTTSVRRIVTTIGHHNYSFGFRCAQ